MDELMLEVQTHLVNNILDFKFIGKDILITKEDMQNLKSFFNIFTNFTLRKYDEQNLIMEGKISKDFISHFSKKEMEHMKEVNALNLIEQAKQELMKQQFEKQFGSVFEEAILFDLSTKDFTSKEELTLDQCTDINIINAINFFKNNLDIDNFRVFKNNKNELFLRVDFEKLKINEQIISVLFGTLCSKFDEVLFTYAKDNPSILLKTQ